MQSTINIHKLTKKIVLSEKNCIFITAIHPTAEAVGFLATLIIRKDIFKYMEDEENKMEDLEANASEYLKEKQMLNESTKDDLFIQNSSLDYLREQYRKGKIKLSEGEMDIVRFCHGRDMKAFIKEEFEKHPINLDENGSLIGGNPFERERKLLKESQFQIPRDLNSEIL